MKQGAGFLTVYTFLMQVYGFIASAYRICTGFSDPGKWLLSAQVYQQFFRGIVFLVLIL